MKDVAINNTAIKSLVNTPRGGTKKFLWDRELPGFGVYRNAKGVATFVYRYKRGAKQRSIVIGKLSEITCSQARDIARDHAHSKRKGVDVVQQRRDAAAEELANTELLIGNYAEEYIARKARSKTPFPPGVQNTIRKQIVGALGHIRMDRLTLREVEDAGEALSAATGGSGRWFYVYVKQMLADAERRNTIDKSPLKALEIPVPNERDRVLNFEEITIFMASVRDIGTVHADMFETLLRVPKRKSEVVDATWDEFDLARGVWTIPGERTKNGEVDTIRLPAQVVGILQRQQPDAKRRAGNVFRRPDGRNVSLSGVARGMLDGCMQRRLELGEAQGFAVPTVEHYTIHDLRTAVATALQKAPFSIEPHVLEAMLNHKVPSKVQRTYQRGKYVDEVGDALRRWNDHLDTLFAQRPAWLTGTLPHMKVEEARAKAKKLTASWPKRPTSKQAEKEDDA